MELLRFIEELREPEDFFGEVPNKKPQKEIIDLAIQLINQKYADFNPDNYKDRYQEALKRSVDQKSANCSSRCLTRRAWHSRVLRLQDCPRHLT